MDLDEQAIGGGQGTEMGKSSAELADNSGPLSQRIISKNWSVRATAYEELHKLCEAEKPKSKSAIFQDHAGMWGKYLTDNNPGALEKALNCMLVFLDRIHKDLLSENQNSMITTIVEKCITHMKPVVKEKSTECLLLIFEVSENFENSAETLQSLCGHKNIKIMTSGTLAVAILLQNYGVKKVRIADFAEQMLKNAMNTNPDCKKAGYDFYKAMYKWIGEAVMPQIEDKLKKQQIDDLKKLFEEVKEKGDKTARKVRTDQAKEAKAAAEKAEQSQNDQIDAIVQEEEKVEEINPLEFAPVKDVIGMFGGEWMDKVAEMKKWDEKVAKLEEISKECKGVKVKAASADNLANFLKKEIANSNINISNAALSAATALAEAMKRDFLSASKILVTPAFMKFKEKRPNIQEACTKFANAIINVTNLEELQEDIVPLISNVAPLVKIGLLKFVENASRVTYIDVLQRAADAILPAVAKSIDDKEGPVRDQALQTMGVLKGRLGVMTDKHIAKAIMNPLKTTKIEEASKTIEPSKYDRPENYKPPAPKKPKAAPAARKDDDDGDEVMSFESKPKRAPPKGIGIKPKKKTDEDEDMKDETPPSRKAPVSKPRAAASSSKGPSVPVINDEDVGNGCSKEEAVDKVNDFFDASTVKKFEDAKWQTKLEAFAELQEQISEKEARHDIVEAAAKFVKNKMKDWKESNINLQKAIVFFYAYLAKNCDQVNKRTVHCAMSFFVDKIGDVKLSVSIKEMLLDMAEIVTPKFICLQVIKYAATTKAPKNIQESCNIITELIENFGIGGIAMKETIDFGKIAAAHATPAIRQAGMKLYIEIYKHAGEVIRSFLTDIKESTLKVIEAELDKLTQYKKGEFQKKRQIRGAADEEEKSGDPKSKKKAAAEDDDDDPFASLPREDISKKLNGKLMEMFKNKDWKIRKKAGEEVEAILKESKMRIENIGLNDLMDALKGGMKDPNKAVVKVFINLLGSLAEAIGAPIKQYVKKCLVPLISNITDKQTLVRADVLSAMNKWKDAIGAPAIINQLSAVLEIENPEARNEGFKWLQENLEEIPNCDTAGLVKPLTLCLTDKSKDIRQQSELIIEIVMPIVGSKAFYEAINNFKQAIKQTVKPMIDNLKQKCDENKGKSGPSAPVEREEPVEKKPVGSFNKAAELKKKEPAKREKSGARAPSPKLKKKGEEENTLTIKPLNKSKRQAHDQKTKWPLNEVKGDHIEKLQAHCMEAFGEKFHDQMWSKATDFIKHIKCVEQLEKLIESQPDELTEVLDLIFKWSNVRLNENSNTKLMVSILDLFGNLMEFLIKIANPLEDFEINVLLGILCEKSGVNNKILMDKIHKLIRMCYDVYDHKLCYRLIIDYGVKAKNLKSVAESLDEVGDYIQKNGIDNITKKDFQLFVSCADCADKSVREQSLKVFAEAYLVLGEDIWRLLSKDVPLKVKGLLEQRFKQTAKKAGTSLAMSTNSQNVKISSIKANPLLMSNNKATKRQSVMVEPSLKFNRPKIAAKEASMNSSSNSSSKITKVMDNFAPFTNKELIDEEMKNEELKKDFHNVYDEEMKPEEGLEDNEAIILGKHAASISQPQDIPKSSVKMNENDDKIAAMLRNAEDELELDPVLREEKKNMMKHITQLVEGDLLQRVDSLVVMNELISNPNIDQKNAPQDNQNQQKALIRCCNELIGAFTHVMRDIFSYPVNDIPLRFTKYFVAIVTRTCACKEIMKEVNETQVFNIAEQLLTRLLIQDLDKIGQNKEGEFILKNLNSAMLRMLENCNHSYIFVVLFTLLKQNQNNQDMPKLPGLIIKCLLKLSKIMDKIIEKIELGKFLVSIHEYLCVIDHDNKTQNDDLGIRIVKTLVNEVVKLKKESIWDFYSVIEHHSQPDNHIKKWIQIILRSLQSQPGAQGTTSASFVDRAQDNAEDKQSQPQQSRMYIEFEIKKLILDLKDPAKNEAGIQKLDKFSKQNPNYDFVKNLNKESEQFAKQILNQLGNFRNGNSWKSTNEDSLGASGKDNMRNSQTDKMTALKNRLNAVNQGRLSESNTSLNNSLNRQQEFKNKMAQLKNKGPNNQPRATLEHAPQSNLNSSFSALNNSLSQKWAAINAQQKKGTGIPMTGRPQTAQTSLAQTITPGSGNQLNSSSNKFQSRMGQGNFQNRLENKAVPPTNPVQGISNNSFRSRIQGFQGGPQAQTNVPLNPGGASASNQELQRRLNEMKTKFQNLNKK